MTPLAQLPPPTFADYIPFYKSDTSNTSYNAPRPAPGGVVGWFNDQIRKFKNRNNRSAAGAYEPQGGAQNQRRGFGPLDPDEAWDARVGVEADSYYEERPPPAENTGYSGAAGSDSYAMNLAGPYGRDHDNDDEDRGRRGRANPFDDDQESSLRGVSPRPMEQPRPSVDTRRSAFREDV